MMLSVIIITKNEAAAIARCLDSVAWCGERIVLDSGSSDDTAAIAARCGARVETAADWPGYGAQKNRVLAYARGEWVLSLDADEWVPPELRAAIEAALAAPGECVAFRMPRQSSFCGRIMRHSGWWPDHVIRLFKRGHARFSDDLVHEKLLADGAIGTLPAALAHEAVRDLAHARAKVDAYSTAGAEMLYRRGKRASRAGALVRGAWAFVRAYVLRRGFLDGREGYQLALSNAAGTYYRYMKLIQLTRQRSS